MNFLKLIESRYPILYHATNLDATIGILGSNTIQGRANLPSDKFLSLRNRDNNRFVDTDQHVHGVSLTRDIQFAQYWDDYIFVLDRDKLSQRYKIQPFYYFQGSQQYRQGENAEAEEFLFGDIKNLSRYLVRIIISRGAEKEIEEYEKQLIKSPNIKKLTGLMRLYHYTSNTEKKQEIQNIISSRKQIRENSISDIITGIKEKFGRRYPLLLDHLKRFRKEMNETTELGKLIIRSAKGEKLTSIEIIAIKEQFKDLAKLIWIGWPQLQPLPGVGLLWIPIAIKLLKILKIDHRPSAWRD
jgi:hypothetical protein